MLLVGGDLHNIGDLALTVQNVLLARDENRKAVVRTWGQPSPAARKQLHHYGASWINGRNLAALIACAFRRDIVLGGGELIRANTSIPPLLFLWMAVVAARLGGGSVSIRGLGAGRVTGLRARLWRGILERAGSIAVRDERSAENVRLLSPFSQPVVAADMAFLGNRIAATADNAESRFPGAVVIAPCIDASEQRHLDSGTIARLAAAARERWPQARIVLACHDARAFMDRAAAERLVREAGLDATLYDADGDLAHMQALYRDARLVITNRLHAGIFSLLHDTPLLVIDDGNPKLGILTREFGCPAVDDLPPDLLPQAIERALNQDLPASRAVRNAMNENAARNLDAHRTVIFNVKYSPNLGDGVIAECLEGELRRCDPRLAPFSIDMAGRTDFCSGHGRHRRRMLATREWLPDPVRSRLIPLLLSPLIRFRHAPRWRRRMRNCSSVVIGGGALFADVDQNFPIKLSQAVDLATENGLPVAIASVGVTNGWSRQGLQRLISRLLRARVLMSSVRDQASAETWNALFGARGVKPAKVAPDPGLLSARQFGHSPRTASGQKRIALCVTAPIALRLHHEDEHNDRHLEAWMQGVARDLASRGCSVTLFTNGSPEDRLFRDRLRTALSDTPEVEFAGDFATPQELAHFISGFDCILAHRLHACIVAYSYRIPCIGFAWDRKLRSFFEQTLRGRFVADPRAATPMDIAGLALAAMDEGVDAETHGQLVEEAAAAVRRLADCLLASNQGPAR
ncbi:polysaccharide pyruvyl transferase family protein [Novosphingobium beihaiensis]|uniref:Polysaccharide pyruvyl transferase family protein n=1 Tax=Novosphingobium beihaiensis TaxID=2930389 RepID=A0ABT0BU79_9SPHN|nr:polysaccharide pyruvyl transferase family protein [Novosphingobium beihaiensis]MCJ2188386.1 polysaccharide pyruvyl transferase family protein [Novosphingobium beihaiensis]